MSDNGPDDEFDENDYDDGDVGAGDGGVGGGPGGWRRGSNLGGDGGDDDGGGDDGGDEDEDDEGDELSDAAVLAGNPVMERIRLALTKQLEAKHAAVTEDLRVKGDELKKVKRNREDIGVELYGVQQQLAKLQMGVEKLHENYNGEVDSRTQQEEQRAQIGAEFERRKQEYAGQEAKMYKLQAQLDKINATMLQVEKYNEEMKSQIEVARRVTHKAEESVSQLEEAKVKQDLYVDELTQRMKQLHEQLAMFSAQYESQRAETGSARETLKEAANEMEKIRFEKKQLLNRWRSTLLAIARRDEDLQTVEKAIREWQEKMMEVNGQVNSYKVSIRQEEETNERLVGIVTKVRNEAEYLKRQVEAIGEQKARLNEQFVMLKKSLDTTDAEFARVAQEQKLVDEDAVKIDRAIVEVVQETQEVEQTILRNLSDQTTLEKDKQHVAKATEKMRQEIHRKENEMAQVQNELARIKVDSLNTVAHNEQLAGTLKEIETELKRKEQLIAKYELEIRRRTDELEKKMRDLDGLNRKYENIKQRFTEQLGAEMAEVGPLEATIRNLGREIEALKRECNDLQRLWMTSQTELVHLQNEASSVSDKLGELKASQAVLNQKRIRLEASVNSQNSEIKELDTGIKVMHSDMSRLNDLIARNGQLQAALKDSNFTIESTFQNKLKDLEETAIRMEGQVVSVKEDKDRLLQEVVEAERQLMLLDRKIELEKETQSAYNQEDDTGELIAGMKKEIHRMTLRYNQLMRRQEELVSDMERNISKRENIAIKGNSGGRAKQTQGDMHRLVGDLTNRVRECETELTRCDKTLRDAEREQDKIAQNLDDTGNMCSRLKKTEADLRNQLQRAQLESQAFQMDAIRHQKMIRLYQDAIDGKHRPADEAAVRDGLERARVRQQNLRAAAEQLRASDPRFEAVFRRISELASV